MINVSRERKPVTAEQLDAIRETATLQRKSISVTTPNLEAVLGPICGIPREAAKVLADLFRQQEQRIAELEALKVLTTVVFDQGATIADLQKRIADLERKKK